MLRHIRIIHVKDEDFLQVVPPNLQNRPDMPDGLINDAFQQNLTEEIILKTIKLKSIGDNQQQYRQRDRRQPLLLMKDLRQQLCLAAVGHRTKMNLVEVTADGQLMAK